MSDYGNGERSRNGVVASEIRIGHPGAKQRDEVDPELVESSNSGRGTLPIAQSTRLPIGISCTRWGSGGKRLLDEVGNWITC